MEDSHSILLVDDEEDLVESLQFNLESFGYKVSTALSGNQAFKVYQENPADIVITDIKMPDGDGVSLVQNLIEGGSPPVFSFISGFSEVSLATAYHLGATTCFPKPFNLKDLIHRLSWDILPMSERWSEPATDVQASFDFKINQVSLGRGGFSMDLQDPASPEFEINKLYAFDKIPTQLGELSGIGWLRWRNEKPYKLGVEIQSLNPESLEKMKDYVEGQSPVSYIPDDQ